MRAARADAEAKAAQIRVRPQGRRRPNLTDVLNSPLIQSLVEQQVALQVADRAQLNATLLPGHPRMRELNAQIADLDRQIAVEATQDSGFAGGRGEARRRRAKPRSIREPRPLSRRPQRRPTTPGCELRALEREAAAQRDLLDSYLRRYREALAREQTRLPAGRRARHLARRRVERARFPEEGADDRGGDGRGAASSPSPSSCSANWPAAGRCAASSADEPLPIGRRAGADRRPARAGPTIAACAA